MNRASVLRFFLGVTALIAHSACFDAMSYAGEPAVATQGAQRAEAGAPVNDPPALARLGEEASTVLAQALDYEATIPLEARVVACEEQQGSPREKIVFRGVQGSLVPGYLQFPAEAAERSPCVLLLHGWSGSKEHWWADNNYISGGNLRRALLAAGWAVLALDAQCHGDRIAANEFAPVNHYHDPAANQRKGFFSQADICLQTVRDYRRAIDYLATRPEIDATRLAVVGYSMGGTQTFMLMGVEPRIAAGVAIATPAETARALLAPQNYTRGIGERPLLTILGREDELCPLAHGLALQRLLTGARHQQVLLDGGHKLPACYVPQVTRWLAEHILETGVGAKSIP